MPSDNDLTIFTNPGGWLGGQLYDLGRQVFNRGQSRADRLLERGHWRLVNVGCNPNLFDAVDKRVIGNFVREDHSLRPMSDFRNANGTWRNAGMRAENVLNNDYGDVYRRCPEALPLWLRNWIASVIGGGVGATPAIPSPTPGPAPPPAPGAPVVVQPGGAGGVGRVWRLPGQPGATVQRTPDWGPARQPATNCGGGIAMSIFNSLAIEYPGLASITENNAATATLINTALGLTDTTNVPASMVTVWNQWANSRFQGSDVVDVLKSTLPMLAQFYLEKRRIDKSAKLGPLAASPSEDKLKEFMRQLDAAYAEALDSCHPSARAAMADTSGLPEAIGSMAGSAIAAYRGRGAAVAPYNNQTLDEFFTQGCGADGRHRPVQRVNVQGPAGKMWMFGYLGEPVLYSGDLAAVRRAERVGKRVARALGKTFQNRERRRTRRRR